MILKVLKFICYIIGKSLYLKVQNACYENSNLICSFVNRRVIFEASNADGLDVAVAAYVVPWDELEASPQQQIAQQAATHAPDKSKQEQQIMIGIKIHCRMSKTKANFWTVKPSVICPTSRNEVGHLSWGEGKD